MHFAAQSNPIGNVGSELKQRLHPRQLLATKQSVAALHCLRFPPQHGQVDYAAS